MSHTTSSRLPDGFLWGGAVAAHQFEGGWNAGGKGPSVVDVLTAGAHGVPRRITETIDPAEFYPNHEAIDFYHRFREDIALFGESGWDASGHRSSGAASSPTGTRRSPTRRGWPSTTRCSTNCSGTASSRWSR